MFAKRVGEGGLGLGLGCARGKGEKVVRVHEAFGRWLGNDVASETDRQNSQRRGGGIEKKKSGPIARQKVHGIWQGPSALACTLIAVLPREAGKIATLFECRRRCRRRSLLNGV